MFALPDNQRESLRFLTVICATAMRVARRPRRLYFSRMLR